MMASIVERSLTRVSVHRLKRNAQPSKIIIIG